jgi:hypothetical protein
MLFFIDWYSAFAITIAGMYFLNSGLCSRI